MTEKIVFGGGCFWCTEAVFKMLKGVRAVRPGYAGGSESNPTYASLHTGRNSHAEVVEIEYDPHSIAFRNLLIVFFGSHDATQVNRQGADVGVEYRSIILYTTDEQRKEAESFIQELNATTRDGAPIATEVKELSAFYPAEPEHVDYYAKNKGAAYCEIVIAPKLEKVQKLYADLLQDSMSQNGN